jgi:hypothetical protein
MNPNITLEEANPDEFYVIIGINRRCVGLIWLEENGTWRAEDNRSSEGDGYGFDTKEDAVNWLIGW